MSLSSNGFSSGADVYWDGVAAIISDKDYVWIIRNALFENNWTFVIPMKQFTVACIGSESTC